MIVHMYISILILDRFIRVVFTLQPMHKQRSLAAYAQTIED